MRAPQEVPRARFQILHLPYVVFEIMRAPPKCAHDFKSGIFPVWYLKSSAPLPCRWTAEAVQCIQTAAEDYVSGVLEDANFAAVHSKRVTLQVGIPMNYWSAEDTF